MNARKTIFALGCVAMNVSVLAGAANGYAESASKRSGAPTINKEGQKALSADGKRKGQKRMANQNRKHKAMKARIEALPEEKRRGLRKELKGLPKEDRREFLSNQFRLTH